MSEIVQLANPAGVFLKGSGWDGGMVKALASHSALTPWATHPIHVEYSLSWGADICRGVEGEVLDTRTLLLFCICVSTHVYVYVGVCTAQRPVLASGVFSIIL